MNHAEYLRYVAETVDDATATKLREIADAYEKLLWQVAQLPCQEDGECSPLRIDIVRSMCLPCRCRLKLEKSDG